MTHKATPNSPDLWISNCVICGQETKKVPGGQGVTWVHRDSGAVAAPDPLDARKLIEGILRDADWVIPELARMITDDVLVPADGADTDRMVVFMQRMNALLHNVVTLRLLSLHRDDEHARRVREASAWVLEEHGETLRRLAEDD